MADLFSGIVRVVPEVLDEDDAVEEVHEAFDPDAEELPLPPRTARLIVVGRPNAGKSTLINTLLQSDRLLTGPEAGITRDLIEIEWPMRLTIKLVDTAGLRKKAKVHEQIERMSTSDTIRSIRFADVVALVMDARDA